MNNNKIILRRNPKLVGNVLDDEVILFDEDQGQYYGLNKVGTAIWGLLEMPTSLDQLINKLHTRYDVSQTQCQEEVQKFIETLLDKKIVIHG